MMCGVLGTCCLLNCSEIRARWGLAVGFLLVKTCTDPTPCVPSHGGEEYNLTPEHFRLPCQDATSVLPLWSFLSVPLFTRGFQRQGKGQCQPGVTNGSSAESMFSFSVIALCFVLLCYTVKVPSAIRC